MSLKIQIPCKYLIPFPISPYFISSTVRTSITMGKTGKTLSDHSMMRKPNASKFTDPPPKAGQHDNVQKTNDSARRRRRDLAEPAPKAVPVQTTTPKRVIDPMHPEPIPIKGNPKNGYSVSVSLLRNLSFCKYLFVLNL